MSETILIFVNFRTTSLKTDEKNYHTLGLPKLGYNLRNSDVLFRGGGSLNGGFSLMNPQIPEGLKPPQLPLELSPCICRADKLSCDLVKMG